MELEDTDADVFEIFQQFLYTGSIYTVTAGDNVSDDNADTDDEETLDGEYNRLYRCWMLGEKLSSISFKDAVTDALIPKVTSENKHPRDMHHGIYPVSNPESSIRKLLVDIAVWFWNDESMDELSEVRDHPEFYHDVLRTLHRHRRAGVGGLDQAPFRLDNTCDYHEHVVAGQPCYKTMF